MGFCGKSRGKNWVADEADQNNIVMKDNSGGESSAASAAAEGMVEE